jgi:uncharacterized protein YydD (DUF2326 family)
LTVVRVEAAEKLAKSAKATLDAFNEAAEQRAAVARLIDVNREEIDGLNARTVALMADMKVVAREKEGRATGRARLPARAGAQCELTG